MSDLGNKEIMAGNIKYYMALKDVRSSQVCKELGFKKTTFSDWVNAKAYPRIDKIEMMANYFGISKADLVEKRQFVAGKLCELSDEEYDLLEKYRKATSEQKIAADYVLKLGE